MGEKEQNDSYALLLSYTVCPNTYVALCSSPTVQWAHCDNERQWEPALQSEIGPTVWNGNNSFSHSNQNRQCANTVRFYSSDPVILWFGLSM